MDHLAYARLIQCAVALIFVAVVIFTLGLPK
jgi:hypothetical protein